MSIQPDPRFIPLATNCADECCTIRPIDASTRASIERRRVLMRRVRLLVAATITYNVVEGILAISAGAIAVGEGRNAWRGDVCCTPPTP